MRLTALFAIAVAATAVLLVATGSRGPHIYTLVGAALAAGLIVLLAGALMGLLFLRAGSDHHAEAILFEEEDNQ
jgi:hypothetical protein